MNPDQQKRREIMALKVAEGRARQWLAQAESEVSAATKEVTATALRRERAELWLRAAELRRELADVENRAATIAMPS